MIKRRFQVTIKGGWRPSAPLSCFPSAHLENIAVCCAILFMLRLGSQVFHSPNHTACGFKDSEIIVILGENGTGKTTSPVC